MSVSPATFALPATFLGLAAHGRDASWCIAGIPLDVGTTNRSGARDGPAAIRRASRMLVDGAHPVHRIEPALLSVADIGDFAIALGDIEKSLALIERQAAGIGHLIALGGEHGITLPLLRALAKRTGPLALVHFDAHVDTWPDNFGQRYAHGSVFFHAIEEGLVDARRAVQVGIRSPMGIDVHDWTVERGVRIVPAEAVHEAGPAAVAEQIRAVVGDAPAYLSVDVDVLDPAFAPGTGTPEIGGLASWQLLAILRRLGEVGFVGMDVVEVAPAYDVAEITALAAATVAWEYLALMGKRAAG
ncbi:agmatinase [Rhodoplanes sp. TEM]|uniref:Agmatinase n=1 Tax=Rhodoplanes tepidamans TaxID=200616 RepID=A0ABT5JEN5_RHOTP|nr:MULTISPECIES: agmatinase [Rhodoplanes]MDC7788155.1 agmatinase [Rhodoplanes tepidamans]MDC7987253.1 agmatinase [Rhodoplanes sp. TEM]MDQ0355155.1 agmatinase [Rhodoplanes tepidamans]